MPRLDKIFLRNLHITYSSECIVRAIKEQEEVRVITSSFSDKGRIAVLDLPGEISRSEIHSVKQTHSVKDEFYFKFSFAINEQV